MSVIHQMLLHTGWNKNNGPIQIRFAIELTHFGLFLGEVLSVDESITYSCNDSEAEIGSSMANEIQLTCASNGSLIPSLAEIPACLIPKNCSTPLEANAESGLVYDNSTDEAPLAYRFGTYVCANDSLITDFGNTFEVLCQEDGTFATPDSWPTCREPLDCDDFVPYPSKESLLNDSTTVVEKEGQKAIYVCRDAPTFKVQGANKISVRLTEVYVTTVYRTVILFAPCRYIRMFIRYTVYSSPLKSFYHHLFTTSIKIAF